MPSPVGHALGGLAAGWLVRGAPAPRDLPLRAIARTIRDGWPFAVIGMAPDLDLLVGFHSTYTHSVGAVAAVLLAAGAWAAWRGKPRRWAVACGAALASHILFDWLGSDTTAPIGIMALWPLSAEFYQSPFHFFPAVSRRFREWSFVVQNTRALVFELAVLLPVTVGIAWIRRRVRA